MHIFRLLLALLLAPLLVLSVPVTAGETGNEKQVRIELVDPENFTDLTPSHLIDEFRDYLYKVAARHVADGQRLEVTVSDVDMAGGFDVHKGHQFSQTRQMSKTFPPRIDLSFALYEDGQPIMEGERTLRDLSYLMRVRPKTETDRLFYEKLLIDEWLIREFSRDTPMS